MAPRTLVVFSMLLGPVWATVVFSGALLVQPGWSSNTLGAVHMMATWLGTLLAFVAVVTGVVASMARRQPQLGRVRSLLLVAIAAVFGVGGTSADDAFRIAGFARCGQRLAPIVAAIRVYEQRHGVPPPSIAELGLPIEALATGLAAYPNATYQSVGREALIHGNRWMLSVEAFDGTSWDRFIFLPNGQYPRFGFGGVLEPVGEWAYVHE